MVALSGGVDSAVAALLAKRAGHSVAGVFVRTWDRQEETGACSADEDLASAKQVAAHLGISLLEADFTAEYWVDVFQDLITGYARGLTPNPDLACNRMIKFGALQAWVRKRGADLLVTGHYARLRGLPDGSVQLLKGLDPGKDQTYFLASVQQASLQAAAFPLGALRKQKVRAIAEQAGIPSAARRSSAGICFIGRRKFQDFLAEYCEPVPGRFRDVATGAVLGDCPNIVPLTLGQRAGLGGAPSRTYVVGKDMAAGDVWVTPDEHHSALYTRAAVLHTPHYVAGSAPDELTQRGMLACTLVPRYREPGAACTITGSAASGSTMQPSRFIRLLPEDAQVLPTDLTALFDMPQRAITPQQSAVMYDGDVCLGTALVRYPAQSLYEEQLAGSSNDVVAQQQQQQQTINADRA